MLWGILSCVKVVTLTHDQVMYMLEKTIRIGHLADFYKGLLTQRQQKFVDLYYFENLSLGEISTRYQISRQAVYDHLQRAEKALEDYERTLGLVERDLMIQEGLQKIKEKADQLDNDVAREILAILASIEQRYEGD